MADRSDAEIREWARQRRVCWEFEVLKEKVKGAGIQTTGIELRLFAAPDAAGEPPERGRRPFAELWAELRELAQGVLTSEEGVHVEIKPFDASARFRPETGHVPEVQLTVRFTPARSTERPGPERAQQIMTALERRLKELGLQPKAWRA